MCVCACVSECMCVCLSVCVRECVYVGMGSMQEGHGRAVVTNAGVVGCSHGPVSMACGHKLELQCLRDSYEIHNKN